MIPVVSVDEMQSIDAEAPDPVDVLIGRAGRAVARAALGMLGGGYGRRVVVLAGPGNNGADGRFAADVLRRRGVRTTVLDATGAHTSVPACDLVIDAAFGTGLTRPYEAPDVDDALVLAVDIPSGIRGDTGEVLGHPLRAHRTVTFAALKPGLVLGAGPAHCGEVSVVDIGLDPSRATIHLMDDASVGRLLPTRPPDAHKWLAAVLVVAGSHGMTGAAAMAAAAAQRAGAGMVQIATPGVSRSFGPVEAVSLAVDDERWAEELLASEATDLGRIDAAIVGPGLGTSLAMRHQIREFVRRAPVPMVVDGDGLTALGSDVASLLEHREHPSILTPHDGEFARLADAHDEDRITATRALASATGAVVLRKGPTTVVAAADGRVRLVTAGDQRLATAGTGDVLSGVIGALVARGLDAFESAAAGAHLHGVAGTLGDRWGVVAGDVIAAIPSAVARCMDADRS